jgi:hypothetical protein
MSPPTEDDLLDSRFGINETDVVAETIDSDAIIINLNTGAYYSADGPAGWLWEAYLGHLTPREIAARVAGQDAAEQEAVLAHVLRFGRELLDESLLVSDPTSSRTGAELPGDPPGPASLAGARLDKYTDFADLLRLDPIHEVHEADGWPVPRP